MSHSNPYQSPSEQPLATSQPPVASQRDFEFQGQLNYDDVYHSGKTPSAFSKFQVISGYLLLVGVIALLPLQQIVAGRPWDQAFRSVFLHPISIAVFTFLAIAIMAWRYLIAQVKKQAQNGVGEFGMTRYHLCEAHLAWQYEAVETRLQWDGVERAEITPEQLTLIMEGSLNSKLIFPRRWFNDEMWEQLCRFVSEKCKSPDLRQR